MKQPIISGGHYDYPADGEFQPISGGTWWGSSFDIRCMPAPVGGKARNLRVKVKKGETVDADATFTLYIDGESTGLTCTVSSGNDAASDAVNEVSVSADDLLAWHCSYSGSNRYFAISCEFEPDTSRSGAVFSFLDGGLDTSSNEYYPFGCCGEGKSGTTLVSSPAPSDGTIKDAYVHIPTAPGSGASWTFTLYKNGAPTSLTITISGDSDTSGYDISNDVSVEAGDLLTWYVEPSSGTAPAACNNAAIGCIFDTGTDGEVPVFGGYYNLAVDGYFDDLFGGHRQAFRSAENDVIQIAPLAFELKKLYINLRFAPGSGKSTTWTVRDDGADTDLAVTVSDTATGGNNTSDTVSVADASLLAMHVAFSGTPTSQYPTWGMIAYIEPSGEPPAGLSAGQRVIMVM